MAGAKEIILKIFISHQRDDAVLASQVSRRLAVYGISSYLDVIDPNTTSAGDELGEYLRGQLARCQQLLAVVSSKTQSSWWVPWEIGIATEKDLPIATFAGDDAQLPEYFLKWPYLTTMLEVDQYAKISLKSDQIFEVRKAETASAGVGRHAATAEYYREMRRVLGR